MEQIPVLNQRLIDHYGLFESVPLWRIVWSEDQFEMRYNEVLDKVMELPKYRQWVPNKWVLERCFPVPLLNNKELFSKLTYEPVWVFQDGNGNALPPVWDVCKIVIDSVNKESARMVGKVYKDPMSNPEEARQRTQEDIDALEYALFGNESRVSDAIATKNAVVINNRDMEIK